MSVTYTAALPVRDQTMLFLSTLLREDACDAVPAPTPEHGARSTKRS
jgi:hypothetical protein